MIRAAHVAHLRRESPFDPIIIQRPPVSLIRVMMVVLSLALWSLAAVPQRKNPEA